MPAGSDRAPQTMHAIPIGSPSPTPAPLLGGLLSPVLDAVTNLLPVCSITDLSQADCGAIRNLSVTGVLDSVLGLLGSVPGYHPADIQKAYSLPSSSAGYGQTIGIVVAYDDPKAEADLAVYRSRFNLGTCSTASGCFRKIGQSAPAPLPAPDQTWAQEASIDLDMASAVCPHCRLLLVEANSSAVGDLMQALQTAIASGATVVSNSYTAVEQSSFSAYDSVLNHPGVPIVAGAGDSGFGVGWPASSPYVTAVGGTTLNRALLSARGFTETAWSFTGSGCSIYSAKPAWQHDTGCQNRTVADVAAVADPNTGVAVYDTYLSGDAGWLVYGGTSVAAPIVAGVYALAGNNSTID
ncbi:MAG TPA: S8 family serine peptidase, partial [Candidatus Baltobacteraceae bacterium]|nr:S8 family serine peptidase [Candidatus Baltobacteraceae bacterium]